jgi:hypothetical protein
MGLFKPKWQHKDPFKRCWAVAELTDQAILAQMARTETDPLVCAAVANKLEPAELAKLVLEGVPETMRDAIRHLSYGLGFSIAALERAPGSPDQDFYLDRATDPTILAEIARRQAGHLTPTALHTMAKHLTDQAALAALAEEPGLDDRTRLTLVSRGILCADGHDWAGCRCQNCGLTREEGHRPKRCVCRECGRPSHNVDANCRCTVCGVIDHMGDKCRCLRCRSPRGTGDVKHQWSDNLCQCVLCGTPRPASHPSHMLIGGCVCQLCHRTIHRWSPWETYYDDNSHRHDYRACSRCGSQENRRDGE